MNLNLADLRRSYYGTWIITLNDERVGEEMNKIRAQGVVNWLNENRHYGFAPKAVEFVNKFAKLDD